MDRLVAGIPARLDSRRFPRKLLQKFNGSTLLEHVWARTSNVLGRDAVYVCTPDREIALEAKRFGANVMPSSPAARNGTERMIALAMETGAQEVLNVQADDPLVPEALIQKMLDVDLDEREVWTPVFKLPTGEPYSPNLVKTARSSRGDALYFSRLDIPYDREGESKPPRWGHLGLYRYGLDSLQEYSDAGESFLEKHEKLEQLRFLDLGIRIRTFETQYRPNAVDSPEDLERLLNER